MSTQGIFLDVVGLSYRCGTTQGTTTSDYAYRYEIGHVVTFSIGPLVLGGSISKPLMTISDLLPENTPISDPRLINRARLLYSLSPTQGFEEPIIIDTKVQNVITKYASQVDLDARSESNLDDVLSKICGELKLSPKSVSHTRNHLRREAAGFKVMRDIQIPLRDGNFVFGDVYLPIGHGKRYPVLLSCTVYGRRVICSGPDLEDEKDIAAFEKLEDDWHSTSAGVDIQVPDDRIWTSDWIRQRGFENIATFNTFRYVPHGYAMVKIDPRGVSQTPGTRGVPGQLATDFFDAVEWTAEQSWSDGSSALVGSSYGANVQWSVAQMRPKGLKCFVPFASDIDLYREAAYPGGIPNHRFLTDWNDRMKRASPKWNDQVDLLKLMNAKPFDDDLWRGLSTQPGEIGLPCFLSASQLFIIHGRGAYEAFRAMASEHVHLQVVDRDYYPWASTRYTKWYLRSDGSLSTSPESGPAKRFEYSTKTPPSGRKCGISFQSLLFEEDVEFSGHFIATLSVSSSMPDADVVVTLWVVDEQGNTIPFGAKGEAEPLAKGFLRASHRKTDPSKSLPERSWHTHTRDDYAPLETDEVVLIEVEILPAAGRIRKGWRLRLDITPTEAQPNIPGYNPLPMRVFYSEEHAEGTNAVHLGRDRIGYITCPVVPSKQGYSNVL